MTSTYINDDGVLVIDAGAVVLESTTDLGEPQAQESEGGSTDVIRDCTGE